MEREKEIKPNVDDDRLLGEYEWHYLDQTNYNLIRSRELLIEEENENQGSK